MSFPQHIAITSRSFLDPSLMITNLDWLYLLSIKETNGLSEKSQLKNEEISGFDAYLEQVDFSRQAYIKLRQDYFNSISQSTRLLTENMLNSKNEYFSRVSMMLNKINKSKKENPIVMSAYHKCTYEIYKQSQGINNTSALQSNPNRWPWGFEDFQKSITKQEQLSLFYEPDYARNQFDINFHRLQKEMDHKQLIKPYIEYTLKVGTFKQILNLCDLNIKEHLKLPKIQSKQQHLHFIRSLCDQGGFTITQFQQFTKLNYHQVTMTASLQYLYVLVSSPVGGMYKIGTGQQGTNPGEIYLHVPVKKQDDVQWVYLQNKLYLKYPNGTLDIICPDTFNVLSQMTLHCPELFQHPQMQAINKNYPLITDGEKLYIIGRKLNISKAESTTQKILKEPPPTTSRQQKKKDTEHQTTDNTIKIMDFILYEFDLNKPSGNIQNEEESDKKLLGELYDSFQGYFTRAEISKALNLNKNDMQNAAQWLVEEGEKERNKTTVSVSKQTLLCQAEITTDISAKQVKSSADIGCKDGSILQPSIVSNIIWTMDKKYVAAYTEFGIKIFSKDSADEKEIDFSNEKFNFRDYYTTKKVVASTLPLRGTYILTQDKYQNEFYQNPNYIVSYEHVSKKFYVMHIQWNSTDNQFPALVTIGSDFVYQKQNFQLQQPTTFDEEVTNFLLSAQENRYEQEWRLNDWIMAYLIVLKNLNGIANHFSEEELKKLQSDKSKYLYRLNKGLQQQQQQQQQQQIKNYKEINLTYAYCVEGTYDELKIIWKLFKKFNKIQYLQLLYYWIQHSQRTILLNKGIYDILKEIGEYLVENWQNELHKNIFIKGWTLFMCSNQLQIKYLKLLDDKQLYQNIIQTYSTIQQETDSSVYKLNYKDVKNDSDFNQLISQIDSKATQHLLIEPISRLLIDNVKCKKMFRQIYTTNYFVETDIQQVNQQFWELAKQWATQSDTTKWQLLDMLFKMSFNEKTEWETQHKLSYNILQVLEIGVNNKEIKEILLKYNILSHFLLQLFLSPVIQCPLDCSLLSTLMQINQNFENVNTFNRSQGIDPIGYKIFETSHPYERQKVQAFEDTYFPGALALSVEFDPRCSSDQAHDFLTINSWYSPFNGPLGLATKIKDPMGVSYRISGKLSTRRPILMLGNVIQADFSPSSQVRNEHSLNRWGFKITIRPIYGDTLNVSNILQMVILENIQQLLGFNENRTQDENLNKQLLKWNILKNGRVGVKLDKHLIKVLGQISINQMPYEDATLLHDNNQLVQEKSWYQQYKRNLITIEYQQKEIKKQEIDLLSLAKQQNKLLVQILEKKGEYYKKISDIVSKFTDSFQYRMAKQRSGMKQFIDEFKQIELLVVLVTLYHSGMIDQINLLEHHMTMLQEARNDVINYMLQEVDTMNEYQQNYEGMLLQATEIMEQQKLKSMNQQIENVLWDMLQQRLEGNTEMIYKLCTQQKLVIVENNPNLSLKSIYNSILEKIKSQKLETINPYQYILSTIKQRIYILFLISNIPLVGQQQQLQQNRSQQQSVDSGSTKQLRPLGLERSLSHQVDEKNIDSQKLQKFRQWLDSYQKWKVLHNVNMNQISAESLEIPPVQSVVLFLQQNVDTTLVQVMDLHNRRCIRRIAALKFLNELQGYNGGILCQDVLNYKIEFASSNIKEVLLQEVVKRLNYLMQSIKNDYANYLNQAIQQQIDGTLLEQLKIICMTLCEINQLFQVDNNILWKSREHDYNPHFNPIFKQFLNNIIITGLLSLVFINLDQQYQSVATLSQNILNNVKETLHIITDNLMTDDLLQQLIQILSQELGISLINDEINCRLLTKLHDLIGVKRINFLLIHILDCLIVHQNIDIPQQLIKLLFYILNHTNTPTTMRLAVRISKFFKNINKIQYNPKYIWNQYENGQLQNVKILQQDQQINFCDQLIYRVGRLVDPEYQDNSINQQILNELNLIQKKQQQNNDQQFKVILHLCQEEEISVLLKILYWWEELYPNMKSKLPQTIQEYQELKEKEKKREEQKSQQQEVIAQQSEFQSQRQQQQQQYKLLERVLMTQPEIQLKDTLLGWGFNYSNLYQDMKQGPSDNKKHSSGRVKKQIKKYWRPLNFQELERLYDELYKQNDDVKAFPDEQSFLKQRNFITRIHSHIKEIKNYGSLLTVYGCIVFSETFTHQKASILVELIQSALNGTLPNIPMDGLSEEFKTKADPNKYILLGPIKEITPPKTKQQQTKTQTQIPPQPTSGKSQITVSLCDINSFQSFEFRIDYITLLPFGNTSVNFYNEINRSSTFTQQIISGQIVGQLIFELSQLICQQYDQQQQIQFNIDDKLHLLGLSTILSQQLIQIGPGIPVQIKKQKQHEKQYIISGGEQSGLREVRLISNNDDKLNIQVLKLDEVELIQQDIPKNINQQQLIQLIEQETDLFILRNLLIIANKLQWNNYNNNDNNNIIQQLLNKIYNLAIQYKGDNKFILQWERLIDSKQQSSFYFPQEVQKQIKFLQQIQSQEQENCQIEAFLEGYDNTNIVGSTYMQSLPESCVVSNELKLVQYWEKNILPKIYDYVKGSLRGYEIEDFFEQIRQQLRKGEQSRALEIAYIVCDQRMPNGAIVPETNHDWSTLTIEEVQSGQFVLCRLIDKTSEQLYSKEYLQYKKQGQQFINGQIISVDQRSSSILIMHIDVNNSQQYATWFPVSALKLLQSYIPPYANSYLQETIKNQYNKELQQELYKQAKQLYQVLGQFINVDPITYLQLTIQFNDSCINGWLQEYYINQQSKTNDKLNLFITKSEQIFDWLQKSFDDVQKFVNNNKLLVDLVKSFKKPLKLNQDLDIAGIAIVFKNDATLCQCSGINFYKDHLGINDFYTISSGKETRGRLSPIILNEKQVYCEYYFNGEALPVYQQKSCVSRLPCVIYKIPTLWNTICYIIDQLSTIFMKNNNVNNILALNQILQKAYSQLPHILSQSIIKLFIRNIRKLSTISNETLNEELIYILIEDANQLYNIQKVEPNVLYSSYLQDITELLALSLQNNKPQQIPDWINSYKNLISIADFIKYNKQLYNEQVEQIYSMLNTQQWDHIIYLQDLPCDIQDVLQEQQIRILNPNIDIYKQQNQQIILIDGFQQLNIENVEIQLPQEPQQEIIKTWQCSVCTFNENAWDLAACSICDSPAPSNKIPFQDGQPLQEDEQIQTTTLDEEDEKAEKREKQNYEELVEKLKEKVKQYYQQQQINKENKIQQITKELEVQQTLLKQLNKQQKKKQNQTLYKSKSQQQQQPNDLKNKLQECQQNIERITDQLQKLQNEKLENNFQVYYGKQALEKGKELIQQFLQKRLEDFKNNIKPEIYEQISQLDSIEAWKKLESYGIDFHNQQINQDKKIEILPIQQMKQLLKLIEFDICKETKAVKTYNSRNIRNQIDEQSINYNDYILSLAKYQDLLNAPILKLRQSWAIIKLFNRYLEQCGQFINVDVPIGTTQIFQENTIFLSMGNYMQILRQLIMTPIKVDIVQRVLNKTSISRDSPPKITVERMRLANKNDKTNTQQDYQFTMAYEQMKNIPPTLLRPIKPQGTDPFLAFEVNFKGEDVQGESGPYRQFFADISKELQQSQLLLYPSTNNQAKLGNHKDKYVLNPSSKSNYHLHLYEFLGQLMAISIRTATHFSLDLPYIFWKQIVGEKITFEDIEQVDATMCNLINFMQECPQTTFEENIFENWVTLRTDKSVLELKDNGSKIPVKYEERLEYIQKLIDVKCTESELQCDSLIKGLIKIIPSPLLNWICAEDLELWVCGRPIVDVDLLKRHTRYSGELNENSDRIKYFWEALHELSEQEKLRFIKFCWGQERLPANDEEFERNQIRFMIKPSTNNSKQPNKSLPKADTCFFNLELPNYSSKEILKKQLLTAINFDCDSMNADPRVNLDPNARHRRRGEEDEDDSLFDEREAEW